MSKLALGNPVGQNDLGWALRSLKQIERASFEDIDSVFDDLTITGSFTETRELNVATATLADLVAFVATIVSDVQKRGQTRNPNEA